MEPSSGVSVVYVSDLLLLQMKNKTEGCRELTDRSKGGGCPFQSNVKTKMASHHAVNTFRGTSDAWDLEDFVRLGKKVRACPYYGTRELKNKSQVSFIANCCVGSQSRSGKLEANLTTQR